MASAIPNSALSRLLSGDMDLNANDIRARLCMTNTTCDTEVDAINDLADYTTIDVADATGYADVALADEAVAADDGNNRAEFDATNISFTGLGGDATRDYQGVLLYKYVDGTNANDLPLCFIDFAADVTAAATQVDVPWDAEGILQLAKAA
jgi:hypothetical protein